MQLIESMTSATIREHGWSVRVWRDEDELHESYDNSDIHDLVEEIDYSARAIMVVIVHAIMELPRVSAVEVKDHLGNGIVLYREWP